MMEFISEGNIPIIEYLAKAEQSPIVGIWPCEYTDTYNQHTDNSLFC
jgi:hypothetical protein